MKKIICILLTVFLFSLPPVISAQQPETLVQALGIMEGYPDGSLHGEEILTREAFVKMTVKILEKDFIPASNVSPYTDVNRERWSSGYIQRASELGYFSGYPDGLFRPTEPVLTEQVCKIMLKLLGYESAGAASGWAQSQISMARGRGLLSGVNCALGEAVTRENAAKIIENTLLTQKKDSTAYCIETMGFQYFEHTVLVSATNSSAGYISTSAGQFKRGNFSDGDLHKRGGLIVNTANEIVCFIPDEQQTEAYTVKAVLDGTLSVFGRMENQSLDFEDDTPVYDGNQALRYGDVSGTLEMGDRVTVYYDATRHISYLTLERDALEGPVTNHGSHILSEFGANESCIIFRDGVRSSLDGLQANDICYYDHLSGTLLAYSKKATGIYESASPTKDNIRTVTLSGNTYEVSGKEAFAKLSSGGTCAFGDTITVLFDKDGKIADVVSATSDSEKSDGLTAVLIDTGYRETANSQGESSYVYYAELMNPNGELMEYITDKDYTQLNASVVRVSFDSGKAALSRLSAKSNSLSGIFDWGAKKIGTDILAPDIKILDTVNHVDYTKGKAKKIFPQRLDGVKMDGISVLHLKRNSAGQITELILNNATGDLYQYGIVLRAQETSAGMYLQGAYDLVTGGQLQTFATNNSILNARTGQVVRVDVDSGKLISIKLLEKLDKRITAVGETAVYTADGKKYLLTDGACIYRKITNLAYDGERYETLPASEIEDNDQVSAYYDKAENSGGRIRVIIVKSE